MVMLGLFREWDEEANEEDDDHEDNEGDSILEGSPKPLSSCLLAMLGGVLIVFLVPEVGEGNHKQAQHGVKGIQRIVHDLQRIQYAVNALWCGPILFTALARERGRGDEGNINGHEQNRGKEDAGREDTYRSDGRGAVPWRLVEEHEDGRNGEQEHKGDGIGNPD